MKSYPPILKQLTLAQRRLATAAFLLLEDGMSGCGSTNMGLYSYSLGLKDWDERVWQRTWVNRIGLFSASGLSSFQRHEAQLGPLQNPIHMSMT